MQQQQKQQILVIGAGIAGLTAAHDLQQAGHQVRVLEAAAHHGGRMMSHRLGENYADCGAQFLIRNYQEIFRLLGETGLEQDLIAFEPWFWDASKGRAIEFNINDPVQAFFSGILSWKTRLTCGPKLAAWFYRLQKYSSNDYSAWRAFDDDLAVRWLRQDFNQEIIDTVLDPIIESFYFQKTKRFSKAAACALIQQFKQPCYTLKRGLGSLPDALAQNLEIHYQSPVQRLHLEGEQVIAETANQRFQTDWAVLAIPAPQARALYPQADALERKLLSTPYSRTATLNLQMSPQWRLPSSRPLYTLQIPRAQRRYVTALTVDAKKRADAKLQQQILGLYLTESTADLLARDDAEVCAAMLDDVVRFWPEIKTQVQAWDLVRWPQAVPYYPAGRSWQIRAYHQRGAARRLLLAGDYMGLIGVNGAAFSGRWAAQAIKTQLA